MRKFAALFSTLAIITVFGFSQLAHAQGGAPSVPPLDVSGDWYGQVTEVFYGLVSDQATLAEDASGNLTGMLCLFDGIPNHCGPVSGKASSTAFQMKAEEIVFNGSVDPNLHAVCADGTTSVVLDGGTQSHGSAGSFNFTHCATGVVSM